MRLLLACALLGALLFSAPPLTASEFSWRRGAGAGGCADEPTMRESIEEYLGRELGAVDDTALVSVEIQKSSEGWAADIAVERLTGARFVGRRRLKVPEGGCQAIQQYAALAVALMIDPTRLDGLSEAGPTGSAGRELPEGANESAPSDDETVRHYDEARPPPMRARKPSPTTEKTPAAGGKGPISLLLLPAAQETEGAGPGEAAFYLSNSFEALLQKRETFTVITGTESPMTPDQLEDWVANSIVRGPRAMEIPGREPLTPDYALAPTITRLTVQDAYDFSSGASQRAISARAQLRVRVVDFDKRRTLPSVTVETTLSYAAHRPSARDRQAAVKLVMARLVELALDRLRSHPDFRVRGKITEQNGVRGTVAFASTRGIEEGHRFAYIDEEGTIRGFVNVFDVGKERARFFVRKRGKGKWLVEMGPHHSWTLSYHIDYGKRFSYGEPSSEDILRARAEGKMVRKVGDRSDLGFNLGLLISPQKSKSLRLLGRLRSGFILGGGFGYFYQLEAGVGYEVFAVPHIGLALLPNVRAGFLSWNADSNPERDIANVEYLFGPQVTAGLSVELYQTSTISPFIDLGAQFAWPVIGGLPQEALLDDRYPSLHGFTVGLGIVAHPIGTP